MMTAEISYEEFEARQEALKAALVKWFPEMSAAERLEMLDDHVFVNCDKDEQLEKCFDRIFKLMELDSYTHVSHIYGLAEALKPVIDSFLKRVRIAKVSDEAKCMLIREILDYEVGE